MPEEARNSSNTWHPTPTLKLTGTGDALFLLTPGESGFPLSLPLAKADDVVVVEEEEDEEEGPGEGLRRPLLCGEEPADAWVPSRPA